MNKEIKVLDTNLSFLTDDESVDSAVLIMKTRNGSWLAQDNNGKCYSDNPSDVVKCLKEDSLSKVKTDRIYGTFYLSQINKHGIVKV